MQFNIEFKPNCINEAKSLHINVGDVLIERTHYSEGRSNRGSTVFSPIRLLCRGYGGFKLVFAASAALRASVTSGTSRPSKAIVTHRKKTLLLDIVAKEKKTSTHTTTKKKKEYEKKVDYIFYSFVKKTTLREIH